MKRKCHSAVFFLMILIYLCFWPRCLACGIFVPRTGIEPGPLAMKVWSPNHRQGIPSAVFLNINLLFIRRLILIVSASYLATLPGDSRMVQDIIIIVVTQAKLLESFLPLPYLPSSSQLPRTDRSASEMSWNWSPLIQI